MTSPTSPDGGAAHDGHWLHQLPTLLHERHAVPRARAAELTEEAAQHLAASGRTAQDEFGPVELYALKLAERQASPRARWWLRNDVQLVLLTVITVSYLVQNVLSDGAAWLTALAVGTLVLELALLASYLLPKRSARSSRR